MLKGQPQIDIINNNQMKGDLTMLNEYGDVLTVEDVMEILGIGKNTTYELLRTGEIKCFRIKGKWKIPKQSIIGYINEQANRT